MVLEEWGRVSSLYKQAQKQVRKTLRFPRPAWSYWPFWAGDLSVPVSSLLLLIGGAVTIWGERPASSVFMVFVPLVLGALSVELRTFVNAKTAAQLFPVEYQTHGLAQYPFKAQLKYLHYALFVRALRDHGYSHASMAKLLSFAEIARLPEAPAFRLSQHPGFIYLMGILTPLASNFIKTSPPGRVAEQPQ